MEKRILELLTSHGTLVSPDAMAYISTKNDPEKYIRAVLKNFSEIPLYLTVALLKDAEAEAAEDDRTDELKPDSKPGSKPGMVPDDHTQVTVKRSSVSKKPEDAYEKIERVSPGPRVEFFCRKRRPNWWAFGNQMRDPKVQAILNRS